MFNLWICSSNKAGEGHPETDKPAQSGSEALCASLVAAEEVAGVDFILDVGEFRAEAVGYDDGRLGFEAGEVVDDLGAEEG